MENTLSSRLKKAMAGPPRVSGADLARACGISRPSVSDWLHGKSKSMAGENLLSAAKRLGVRPDWLANGLGPMRDQEAFTGVADTPQNEYRTISITRAKAQSLLLSMDEKDLKEAIFALEYIAEKGKKNSFNSRGGDPVPAAG